MKMQAPLRSQESREVTLSATRNYVVRASTGNGGISVIGQVGVSAPRGCT